MVGSKKHHIHQTRQYTVHPSAVVAVDKLMDELDLYMKNAHDFNVKRRTQNYSRGSLKGGHVNFIPKFELQIVPAPSGFIITYDYYLKEKLAAAVTVGILTVGMSAAIGAGVMRVAAKEALDIFQKFWIIVDSLVQNSPYRVLSENYKKSKKVPSPHQKKGKHAVPDGAATTLDLTKQQEPQQPLYPTAQQMFYAPQPTAPVSL